MAPYFSRIAFPFHDAGQVANAFHVYLSALSFEKELPLWNPYSAFGVPAINMMLYVSPVGYVVGFFGALSGIRDSLLLFKIVVSLELLIFVFGTVRLAQQVFSTEAAKWLVVVGAALSFNWIYSLDGNFHSYYFFPYIFYYWFDFFKTQRLLSFFKGSLWALFSCIGNTPYYSPLLSSTALVFLVALQLQVRVRKVSIEPKYRTIFIGALTLLIGCSFIGSMKLNFSELESFSPGRDPITGVVPFDVFRTYGGVLNIKKVVDYYLSGVHLGGDVSYFIGILPLFFAGYALFFSTHRLAVALKWTATFLLLFSMGGVVTWLAYHLPGMKYYRHIGLIHALFKYLVLVLAGFGLDSWLLNSRAKESWKQFFSHLSFYHYAAFILVVVDFCAPYFLELPAFGCTLYNTCSEGWFVCWIPSLLFAIGYWGCSSRWKNNVQRLSKALVLIYVFEIGYFQFRVHYELPVIEKERVPALSQLFETRPASYVPSRDFIETLRNRSQLKSYFEIPQYKTFYVTAYAVARIDPCIPAFRTDFLPAGVARWLKAQDITFTPELYKNNTWRKDEILRSIGCTFPKMTLLPREEYSAGKFSLVKFGWNSLAVDISANEDSTFEYADAFHSGWRVLINGKRAEIRETESGFKSVSVPKGECRVEFRFWNGWGSLFQYVLFVSSICLFIPLLLWPLCRRVATAK